jgi:hypothetical protein
MSDTPVQVGLGKRLARPVSTARREPSVRVIRRLRTSTPVEQNAAPVRPKPAPAKNPFARLREISERWSRATAHVGADPDILVIDDVARILRCTVDTARRIPRDQLRSIAGPGRRHLYLREDVIGYVRSRARQSPNAELLLAGAAAEVLGWPADRVRERSQRRRTS